MAFLCMNMTNVKSRIEKFSVDTVHAVDSHDDWGTRV
jgi:hypothetical protein